MLVFMGAYNLINTVFSTQNCMLRTPPSPLRCSLQGCVVCSHARIEDKVTLKDCHVGANFTITKEGETPIP